MKKSGFTLVEVLIAMVLIGFAIASLMAANISFTRANGAGADMSTAEFLVEQVRGYTAVVSYDNLYSFDDTTYSPPVSVNGESLSDFSAFSQVITVENVSNSNFETVVADYSSDFIRVSVRVLLNSKEVASSSWIRADID